MPTKPKPKPDAPTEVWRHYWTSAKQPWRWEPELDPERIAELEAWPTKLSQDLRTKLKAEFWPSIDIVDYIDADLRFGESAPRLDRAAVEWLLSEADGPVNWSDPAQQHGVGVDLSGADLRCANLNELPLARTNFTGANLENSALFQAHWEGAILRHSRLGGANLQDSNLERAELFRAHLEGANLTGGRLNGASLAFADLEGAVLRYAHLKGADLRGTNLKGANLTGANLNNAQLDKHSLLMDSAGYWPQVADVDWTGVNLNVLNWRGLLPKVGDERADKPEQSAGRADYYYRAAQANVQLTTTLRGHGIARAAHHFAYRARIQERKAAFWAATWAAAPRAPKASVGAQGGSVGPPGRWRRARRLLPVGILQWLRGLDDGLRRLWRCFWGALGWLASLAVWGVAGYGYRPRRCVGTYVLVILTFAIGFALMGKEAFPFPAVFTSMYAFHGRGLGPAAAASAGAIVYGWGAIESLVGLVLEITFIATFTQRLLRN